MCFQKALIRINEADGENNNLRLNVELRLVEGLSEYPLNQLHTNNYSESLTFDVDLNIEGTRICTTEIGNYIVRMAVDVLYEEKE